MHHIHPQETDDSVGMKHGNCHQRLDRLILKQFSFGHLWGQLSNIRDMHHIATQDQTMEARERLYRTFSSCGCAWRHPKGAPFMHNLRSRLSKGVLKDATAFCFKELGDRL